MSWTTTVVVVTAAVPLFYLVGAVAVAYMLSGDSLRGVLAGVYLVLAVAWPLARARRARRSGRNWSQAIRAAALISLAMNLVLSPLAILSLAM